MRSSWLVPAVLCGLLLTGCPASVPSGPATVYACEGGVQLQVRFVRNAAWVTMPDGSTIELPQRPSGSGFWYGTPRHALRGKGREAQWTVGRAMPLQCLALSAPA